MPFDMHYYDSKVNYKINLKQGFQHLDGKKAEMFIRYIPGQNEHNLTRESNQKTFIEEFISQKINNDIISELPDLFAKTVPYITSDITLSDAPRLFDLTEQLRSSDIHTHSLKGRYEIKDNIRYFVSDYETNKNILK